MDTDKHGLQKQKSELRSKIRARLSRISAAGREAASLQIYANLKEQPFFKTAVTVLFFAPLPDEADVWPLLEETMTGEKIATLPYFIPADQSYAARRVQNPRIEIAIGQFGIREPKAGCNEVALSRVDLILVPGVAFDLSGRRLGRSRGFYDRLLAETSGLKCGIAFDEQIVGEVPTGEHDRQMDFILTPTRCVEVRK